MKRLGTETATEQANESASGNQGPATVNSAMKPRPFRWLKNVWIFTTDQLLEFDSERAEVLARATRDSDGAEVWLLKGRGLGLQWQQIDFPDGHSEGELLGVERAKALDSRMREASARLWTFTLRA